MKLKADAIPKAKILEPKPTACSKAVVDAHSGEILGVTPCSAPEAHEIINLFKMAIDFRVPARYVKTKSSPPPRATLCGAPKKPVKNNQTRAVKCGKSDLRNPKRGFFFNRVCVKKFFFVQRASLSLLGVVWPLTCPSSSTSMA